MSNLPKPKTLPAPKRINADKELESQKHQDILDWLWANLELIVQRQFSVSQAWVDAETEKAIRARQVQIDSLQAAVREALEDVRATATDKQKLNKVLSNLDTAKLDTLPVQDMTPILPNLTGKVYQQALTEQRRRGSDVCTETIGYVDVAASVAVPDHFDLKAPSKRYFGSFDSGGELSIGHLTSITFPSPQWTLYRRPKEVLFDVRATLPVTGVLVRELRTLREYAGSATIVMVAPEIPESVAEVLSNEKFMVLDRSKLEKAIAASREHGE